MRGCAVRAGVIIALALLGCGGIESQEPSTCTVAATIVPPWTGTPTQPVDSGGQDASLWLSLSLPHDRPLRSVSAIVAPADGHATLPERLPWFSVSDEGGGAVDAVGTAFETAADIDAYEVEHPIKLDVSRAAWVPPAGHKQWIRFDSEGGKGALVGLEVRGWVCE